MLEPTEIHLHNLYILKSRVTWLWQVSVQFQELSRLPSWSETALSAGSWLVSKENTNMERGNTRMQQYSSYNEVSLFFWQNKSYTTVFTVCICHKIEPRNGCNPTNLTPCVKSCTIISWYKNDLMKFLWEQK